MPSTGTGKGAVQLADFSAGARAENQYVNNVVLTSSEINSLPSDRERKDVNLVNNSKSRPLLNSYSSHRSEDSHAKQQSEPFAGKPNFSKGLALGSASRDSAGNRL